MMRKVLIFNDSMQFGGTETLLVDILHHISKKDHLITLLLPYPSSNNILLKDIPSSVTIQYIFPEKPKRMEKIFFENLMSFFPRVFAKNRKLNLNSYDLIISFKDSIFSIVFSRTRKRKILWIHNLPVKIHYGYHSMKEFIPVMLHRIRMKRLIHSFRKFDKVICVSHSCKENYISVFNNNIVPEKQECKVIYNAIDFSKIEQLSLEESNETNNNATSFVMVARLSAEKRIDRVIKAAYKLKTEGYNFQINIIGNGDDEGYLKKLISQYPIEDTIRLLGYKNNPYPIIKESDWLICSSEKESFSLVVLEAVYLGTPVITTNCGGPTEILNKGEYGVLTENSTEGVYMGMKKALENPEIKEFYKGKSQKCIQRFDYKEWLESVEEIFNS